MKAMIFAAGMGTRLQPLTEHKPKALVEINGKPMLEHVIFKLIDAGIDDITINVHHFANQIIEYIERRNWNNTRIHISNETNLLLDTGGGLQKAIDIIGTNENILLHNVDIISSSDLNEFCKHHDKIKADASLLVRERESSRYLYFTKDLKLNGWVNTKTNDQIIVDSQMTNAYKLAFSGISIVSPIFLKRLKKEGKYGLTTVLLEQAKFLNIFGYQDKGSFWADTGSVSGIMKAEQHLKDASYE